MVDSGPELELRSVTAGYSGPAVLHDVDLSARRGEVLAVYGPNASGKSTLLRTVAGLTNILAGEVRIAGVPLAGGVEESVRSGVALQLQPGSAFRNLTVLENLRLWSRRSSPSGSGDGALEALKRFPELGNLRHRRAGVLSGGEGQLLGLACMAAARPRLLLLDEPTLGLAPGLAARIIDRIGQLGSELDAALLVVEHRVEELARIADAFCVLSEGKVVLSGRKPAHHIDDIRRQLRPPEAPRV